LHFIKSGERGFGRASSKFHLLPADVFVDKSYFFFRFLFFSARVAPALTPAMAVIPALIRARSHLRSPAPFLHSQTRHHPQRGARHRVMPGEVTRALLSGAHRVNGRSILARARLEKKNPSYFARRI